jgi:hypothetical protein
MTVRRLLLVAAVAAVLAMVAGCGSQSTPATPPASTEASGSAEGSSAAPAAPTLEELKGLSLAVKEESLVFDYLIAGKLPALESRFGKPNATYKTAADESSTGSAELADGRTYQVQTGLNDRGVAVVMAHGVEARKGQSQTPADTAFLKAMVDGTTTLEQANAYLKGVGATTVRPAVMDPKGVNAPAYVWAQPDDSGFLVVDLSGLTAEQMTALEIPADVPFQVLYWTAPRWRAY